MDQANKDFQSWTIYSVSYYTIEDKNDMNDLMIFEPDWNKGITDPWVKTEFMTPTRPSPYFSNSSRPTLTTSWYLPLAFERPGFQEGVVQVDNVKKNKRARQSLNDLCPSGQKFNQGLV